MQKLRKADVQNKYQFLDHSVKEMVLLQFSIVLD
jgi:hypothetical protein